MPGLACRVNNFVRGVYEFKTTNSFSQIENAEGKFIITNLYEFVHAKSVSVCKTSNLSLQICEGFKYVSL